MQKPLIIAAPDNARYKKHARVKWRDNDGREAFVRDAQLVLSPPQPAACALKPSSSSSSLMAVKPRHRVTSIISACPNQNQNI